MAYLVKPELNEMDFRRKLHESEKTMGGKDKTESFPESQWAAFYKKYVDADPKEHFYRYQYCPDCADFTGELGWNHNLLSKRYELFILIQYEKRNDGYGRDGMEKLFQAARRHGIAKLYAVVPEHNEAAPFFEHIGMKAEEIENHCRIFSKTI